MMITTLDAEGSHIIQSPKARPMTRAFSGPPDNVVRQSAPHLKEAVENCWFKTRCHADLE